MITCQMRASEALVGRASRGHLGAIDPTKPLSIRRTLDALDAVDTFAALLDEAMTACTSGSGHLDLKDMSAYVLKRVSEGQR